MKVIFIQDVKKQAKKDEIKEVKDGYAKFLIEQKLAVPYTTKSAEVLKGEIKAREDAEELLIQECTKVKNKLKDKEITFKVKTGNNDKVFAYSRSYKGETIIVIGNLDYKHVQKKVVVKASGVKKEKNLQVIQGLPNLRTKNNRIYTDLGAGEIKVLRLTDFSL